jgi:hypothetical protein
MKISKFVADSNVQSSCKQRALWQCTDFTKSFFTNKLTYKSIVPVTKVRPFLCPFVGELKMPYKITCRYSVTNIIQIGQEITTGILTRPLEHSALHCADLHQVPNRAVNFVLISCNGPISTKFQTAPSTLCLSPVTVLSVPSSKPHRELCAYLL